MANLVNQSVSQESSQQIKSSQEDKHHAQEEEVNRTECVNDWLG